MTDTLKDGAVKVRKSHIFKRDESNFYIEPEWCSVRLFESEQFSRRVLEPFTGTGRVANAARSAGYETWTSDKTDRGYPLDEIKDFLDVECVADGVSIVSNPPFEDEIAQHAIRLDPIKMALIWPLARVVAAWPWLAAAPLARVLLLTPRPPLPPGDYIAAGRKPESARVEHCWLIFERGYRGYPRLHWLHRDHGIIPGRKE
jgi:hypothetical protein